MKTICLSVPDKVYNIIEHYTSYLSITRSRFISSCVYELCLLHDVFDFEFFEHLVSVPFTRSFSLWTSDSSDSSDIFKASGAIRFISPSSLYELPAWQNKNIGGHEDD